MTVAVVTRDQAHLLEECLAALSSQTVAHADVVVVDNASVDATASVVRRHAAHSPIPIRMVRQEGSIGAARQRALDEATGEFVAFTDTDCRPHPDWLGHALRAFDGPDVHVVQGRTQPAGPTHPWCATQDIARFTHLYETCNIVYRTEALRRAGGFDPEWGFFGEDTVAGWRVRRLGGTGRFAAEAIVDHVVFAGGLRWHLRRAARYSAYNALVRRFPEMRTDLLWHRAFLRRRSAEFDALVTGAAIAVASRRPSGLVVGAALAAPWLHRHAPARAGGLRGTARALAFEAVIAGALLNGSIRERTVVL